MINKIVKKYQNAVIPLTATIELINLCNWKCKHCYLDDQYKILDSKKVYDLLQELRSLGTYEVKFSGGEPTLMEDLPKIIACARKLGFSVVLLTNLSNLSENLIETINHYGISRVETTLFSNDEQVHDQFVQKKGAFNRTLNNLVRLKEMNVNILVKTWALKSNIDKLIDMSLFFEKLGFQFNIHTQIYPDIHGIFKLPQEEMLSAKEYAEALKLSDKSFNRKFPLNNKSSQILCEEFLYSTYITSYGDVIPCAKVRIPVGNIYKNTMTEIWNNSERLHKFQHYSFKDIQDCSNCQKKNLCVRCGAMSTIINRDFLDNTVQTCLHAEIRKKIYE